jgi:DNA-binding XRE family transcriptional regulator
MKRTKKELEDSIPTAYLIEQGLKEEFAQQIAELREAAGVSQEDFASVVGSSSETIQLIEDGGFKGSLQELHRILNKAIEVYNLND